MSPVIGGSPEGAWLMARDRSVVRVHLRLLIVLDSDFAYQLDLRFEPVDMLFLGFEDSAEQIAAHVVARAFGLRDGGLQHRVRLELQPEVARKSRLDVFADVELVQVLQIRHALEEQDPCDQRVGVLHLVDRSVVLALAEAGKAPMRKHLGVDEILVDRRELVGEDFIELPHDSDIAFHGASPWGACTNPFGPHAMRPIVSTSSAFAHERQRPHPVPTPSCIARSSDERAPSSAARTIWRSVIALQRQMYMEWCRSGGRVGSLAAGWGGPGGG